MAAHSIGLIGKDNSDFSGLVVKEFLLAGCLKTAPGIAFVPNFFFIALLSPYPTTVLREWISSMHG
jgi:hypothetical protein